MTVNEAKEKLVANACCDLNLCDKCPYKSTPKCNDMAFVDEILIEAIDVIMEDIQNETGI